MLNEIAQAIAGREVLELVYPPGRRLVEPHAVGYGSDGSLLLRAFQTEGASASGEPNNWKLFRLDRTDRIDPTGMRFSNPRPGYRKNDKAMKGGIIAQL